MSHGDCILALPDDPDQGKKKKTCLGREENTEVCGCCVLTIGVVRPARAAIRSLGVSRASERIFAPAGDIGRASCNRRWSGRRCDDLEGCQEQCNNDRRVGKHCGNVEKCFGNWIVVLVSLTIYDGCAMWVLISMLGILENWIAVLVFLNDF